MNTGGDKAPSYFSEVKKGELIELKNLLVASANDRDIEKAKEILNRIIYYMTIGMDVSSLFPYVIMNSHTTDIIVKKLVYLYITHYSKLKQELLLLVLNTLTKDCKSANPLIRAMALRTLCSLGSEDAVEAANKEIMWVLRSDPSAYVRKTAIIGLAKVFHLSKASINLDEVLPIVFGLIMDNDGLTVINTISALNEIQPGWPVNQSIVQHLLSKFKDFNEWGQCLAIETITKYTPSSEDEIIDILNFFDDKLKQSNSALCLAIVKLFLKITENETEVHEQVYERIKQPLITLMENSETHETSYAILKHIHLIMSRAPALFCSGFKYFYCKYNDPMYIKNLKVAILKELATPDNAKAIIQELTEYVYEGDIALAKKSISAINSISARIKAMAKAVSECFVTFLRTNIEKVMEDTLVALKDFLRLYPEEAPEVVPVAAKTLMALSDEQAKEALLWMLGEYPSLEEETPYLVEEFYEASFQAESTGVKIQLLTTAIKIFLERPAEMLPTLKLLLADSLSTAMDPDLHDLALLYNRLLSLDIEKAAKIIDGQSSRAQSYLIDDESVEVRDKIFDEFNTLSIVYNKPSSTYLHKHLLLKNENLLKLEQEKRLQIEYYKQQQQQQQQDGSGSTSPSQQEQRDKIKEKQELLIQIEGSTQNVFDSLVLEKSPELSPEDFQSNWLETVEAHPMDIQLQSLPTISEIESSLLSEGVVCLAYGSVDNQTKLYFHAKQAENGPLFLVEILVNENSLLMSISFKSKDLKRLHSKFIPKFLLALSSCIPNIFGNK